jgi:NACalpha-BTF3-like transcription factor
MTDHGAKERKRTFDHLLRTQELYHAYLSEVNDKTREFEKDVHVALHEHVMSCFNIYREVCLATLNATTTAPESSQASDDPITYVASQARCSSITAAEALRSCNGDADAAIKLAR